MREGCTGRDALGLGPSNRLLTSRTVIEAIRRNLKVTPLFVSLGCAAQIRAEEVESETRDGVLWTDTNLGSVSGTRSGSIGERLGHKFYKLSTRGRGVWLRLVRGRGCNKEPLREPHVGGGVEQGAKRGIVKLDKISRHFHLEFDSQLTSTVKLPTSPPVAHTVGAVEAEVVDVLFTLMVGSALVVVGNGGGKVVVSLSDIDERLAGRDVLSTMELVGVALELLHMEPDKTELKAGQ